MYGITFNDVKMPASEAFSEIQICVGRVNYKVKTIVPNQSVIAEGAHHFSWIVIIILILLYWPAALVYYFNRQSSITVIIKNYNEN